MVREAATYERLDSCVCPLMDIQVCLLVETLRATIYLALIPLEDFVVLELNISLHIDVCELCPLAWWTSS